MHKYPIMMHLATSTPSMCKLHFSTWIEHASSSSFKPKFLSILYMCMRHVLSHMAQVVLLYAGHDLYFLVYGTTLSIEVILWLHSAGFVNRAFQWTCTVL